MSLSADILRRLSGSRRLGVAVVSAFLIALFLRHSIPAEGQEPASQQNAKAAADRAVKEADRLLREGTGEDRRVALVKLEEARKLYYALGDRDGEVAAVDMMGFVNETLGENQKALEYYMQELPLQRVRGSDFGIGTTLVNIGAAYAALGENRKALEHYDQALPILRAVGNPSAEAAALASIGAVYSDLGENQKALDYYNQALVLGRAGGDRSGEGGTLALIGKAYSGLGEKQKALDYFNKALPLQRDAHDKSGEGFTLRNIGLVYFDLGEKQKALQYFSQVLRLAGAAGDRFGEAVAHHDIGTAYFALAEKQKALEHYSLALALERAVKDPMEEGDILDSLMTLWKAEAKPHLAIFLGKQAVNSYQQIRRNIQGLEKTTQKSFATSVEGAYRRLADLLVSQGRLFEAQQVLGLLKEEEFKEFTRDDDTSGAGGTLTLTSTERTMEKRYIEAAGSITTIGSEWSALNDKKQRTGDEETRFQQLGKRLTDVEKSFQTFIEQELYEQLGKSTQADTSVRELEQKTSDLQAVLHDLDPGAVALYTVAAPERLILILVTPDVRVAREYPIKPEALREKVFALWSALRTPASDPLPSAQELYKIVLGPVEKDLEAAHAKTLMWSLDDVLRYIPIAALHDGRQYVVEKYRNEVFTLSSISKLKDALNESSWRVLAMGVSKSYGGSSPLPTVRGELQSIVRTSADGNSGLLPGLELLDDDFTEEAFTKGLAQRFPLVHIASHFSFQAGADDFSYLLLGGKTEAGERLTLAQIKTDPNIRFWNTELLTLSACETAMGGERNGREVDGLGEVLQRKGAKAVIASLWSVNDRSTGALMRRFYETWTTHPGMPKAEALRLAQVALLKEEVKPDVEGGTQAAQTHSFAHPYFWAPFILIGNWR
jgi:CHAT domain-containing protein/tetratricopeptide (TPR) repeat protein